MRQGLGAIPPDALYSGPRKSSQLPHRSNGHSIGRAGNGEAHKVSFRCRHMMAALVPLHLDSGHWTLRSLRDKCCPPIIRLAFDHAAPQRSFQYYLLIRNALCKRFSFVVSCCE